MMHLAFAEEITQEKPMLCDGDTWEENWKRALFNSFLRVDSEIESVAPETVGSTSVVAVVFPTHIFVANCGDSIAVLCRDKTPLPLSNDRKPDREDEAARIVSFMNPFLFSRFSSFLRNLKLLSP